MRAAAISVVALAAFAAGAPASAAGAASVDRPGRVLFEQAETKFNLGRFDDALADYQAAYEVEPLPAFLFNIGQCYRNLGNYERAQFYFRRYVALDPDSSNRPAAERLVAEMGKLAREQASAAPRNAQETPPALAVRAPAAGEGAVAVQPVAYVAQPVRAADARPPLYRRPLFWVAVSAVVVGGAAAAFALRPDDPQSSLRPIDAR
jgi:tetratricopeptide (TPR) repeat protein